MPKYGMVQSIPLDKVVASPFQVRKEYGDIESFAKDISKKGLLQPILVRPIDEHFEIVHGHRRWIAIKVLNWKFIQCFIKELTDHEAFLIQGSENIQREDLNHIEEGTYYKNYRAFMLKEGKIIGSLEIAKAFHVHRNLVQAKMGILDLPQSVQNKLIEKKIPFLRARALVTLTRKGWKTGISQYGEHKERTTDYFREIEFLSDEIEKGSSGGLRTNKGVTFAVEAIKKGKSVFEAVELAKQKEHIEIALKWFQQGKSPEEIVKRLSASLQDPAVILAQANELVIKIIQKNLQSGTLSCPTCGKSSCLHWSCSGERLLP